MSGAHEHTHGHGHSHDAPKDFGRAFAIGIALNLAFVGIEAAYGILSNSLALLSDAGHNLSDVLGLALAWFATRLAKRKPSDRFTYGLRGSSILASLFNAVFLLVAVGGILWESVGRLTSPSPVEGTTVIVVAAVGILINGFTAYMFVAGKKSDLNIRGAYLHMAADALVSLGVVIAGFVIMKTGLLWIDPAVSIVIGLVIIWGTWSLLRDSVFLSLGGVPSGLKIVDVREFLMTQDKVSGVHDLHVWALSTSETALTAHVIRDTALEQDDFIREVCKKLTDRFHIKHITLQIELGTENSYDCPLDKKVCL